MAVTGSARDRYPRLARIEGMDRNNMPVLSTMTEWELHTALNEIDTLRGRVEEKGEYK